MLRSDRRSQSRSSKFVRAREQLTRCVRPEARTNAMVDVGDARTRPRRVNHLSSPLAHAVKAPGTFQVQSETPVRTRQWQIVGAAPVGGTERRGDPYDHRYLGLRDAVRPGSKAVGENSNIPSVIDRGPGCGFPPDPALRVNSLALRSSPSPICISSTQAKSRRWTVSRHPTVG